MQLFIQLGRNALLLNNKFTLILNLSSSFKKSIVAYAYPACNVHCISCNIMTMIVPHPCALCQVRSIFCLSSNGAHNLYGWILQYILRDCPFLCTVFFLMMNNLWWEAESPTHPSKEHDFPNEENESLII